MRYERQLQQRSLTCYCDDDLAVQAQALLDTLQSLHERAQLRNGSTIRFGWTHLRLVENDAELVVCEPDFDGDPFKNVIPEVDRSLRVQAEQVAICKMAGTSGDTDVRFDQTLLLERGKLHDAKLYLERRNSENPTFSGWYIGSALDDDPGATSEAESPEIIRVFELLRQRPELLSVLQLPANYMVIFHGDSIQSIIDSAGSAVWNRAS